MPPQWIADYLAAIVWALPLLGGALFDEDTKKRGKTFTYGHRNPQGLVFDLTTSSIRVSKGLRAMMKSTCSWAARITEELVSSCVEDRDQNRIQIELLQKDLQRSAAAQQDMLSEMFLAIDAKIEELAAQVNRKVGGLSNRIEAEMREAAANQERDMQHLEANFLAISREAASLLENRLAHLENKPRNDQDELREVFADGLACLADRFKALHHG